MVVSATEKQTMINDTTIVKWKYVNKYPGMSGGDLDCTSYALDISFHLGGEQRQMTCRKM